METSTPYSASPSGLVRSPQAADQTPHYAQAVMKVAGRSEVLVTQDIYAASGMKLLARGARIDASLWKTLSQHKLAKPLDQVLASSRCIDHVSLARDIDKALGASALLATMLARTGDANGWKPVLGSIRLPQALAFRFTVMRDEAAQLYFHSLRVTLGAYCIGVRLHQGRLDPDGIDAITDLLPQERRDDGSSHAAVEVERRPHRLCDVLHAWPALQNRIRGTPAEPACRFIDERMMQLQSLARQCGITPDLLELLDLGEDDAVMLRDLHTTLDEMGRLLDGLAFEIERCIPADGPHGALSAQVVSVLRQ